MSQIPRLSNREWEVVELLLQGKSNKLIASSLGISDRTVEFHLKNIYAKFQVRSRIELILKLGNATGGLEAKELGHSTVDGKGEIAENRDRVNSRMNWAPFFRDVISIIGKELEMKNLLVSKPVLVSIVAALLVGLLWIVILERTAGLSVEDFTIFAVPLIIVLAMIGFIVGAIGKQRNKTLLRVLFSVTFGIGLSPFTVIPLMMFVVIPIGRFVANLGMIDPSTISSEMASTVVMSIMIALWLVISVVFGILLLSLSIDNQQTDNHSQSAESAQT